VIELGQPIRLEILTQAISAAEVAAGIAVRNIELGFTKHIRIHNMCGWNSIAAGDWLELGYYNQYGGVDTTEFLVLREQANANDAIVFNGPLEVVCEGLRMLILDPVLAHVHTLRCVYEVL